jgi:site-specific DNA recombinase
MGSRATTRRVRQAVTQRPRVVAGYIRLTVDRQGLKVGKKIQREEIQAWADREGYSVVWFEDQDITAAKLEVVRPAYEEMLQRVAAEEFAGVVVWRLDRLVRLTREFERCFGVLEDSSTFMKDIDQKIDSESPIGKMFMRLLVMMAEMEIAAMRARALAHQQYKAENGLVSGGGLRPFGFVGAIKDEKTKKILNPDDALIKHVPEEAALIREAADRILNGGATYGDIVGTGRNAIRQSWAPPVRRFPSAA